MGSIDVAPAEGSPMETSVGDNAEMFVGYYQKGKGKGKAMPWDIERAQPELVTLQRALPELFTSPVLDIGAGLGDNAIWLASTGATVVSVDVSPEALEECKTRLARHGAVSGSVDFVLCNILETPLPESVTAKAPFATVLDSAIFHCIGCDATQTRYVEAFTPLVKPGGHLVMLIFSDKNPDPWVGPRRISEAHLRKYFCEQAGWKILELVEAKYHDSMREAGFGLAWRMVAERL